MRESVTLCQDGLHLSALQGVNEARSKAYIRYGKRALELTTQQSTKTLGGLRAPLESRTRGCKSS